MKITKEQLSLGGGCIKLTQHKKNFTHIDSINLNEPQETQQKMVETEMYGIPVEPRTVT